MSALLHILFVLLFVIGKDIGRIYKHSQYQLSTSSLKAHVSSSSEPQISSTIELTTKSVPSATDKHQNNFVLYSQNTVKNDATITNNDDIQSCQTPKNKIIIFQPFQHLIIIHNVLLPNQQVGWILTHLRYYLRLVNNISILWRKVNLARPLGVLNQV